MELRDLKYFCMTAELEHVSKAADKLGLTQPYLTKIIGGIEDELGGQLFDKVGRRIMLNDCGRVFYAHAKNIINSMDNMYAEMEKLFEQKSRLITLLCNTESYTQDLIVDFQKKNADYGTKISYASSKDIVMALRQGEADFAISAPPIDENASSGIVTEIICRDSVRVLLPEGHPLLAKGTITVNDLRDERLITGTKGGAIRNYIDQVEGYDFDSKIICETNDFDLIVKAVAGGLGYAFVPHVILINRPELVKHCVVLDSPFNYGVFGLSYNRNAIKSPPMADFHNFTLTHFRELQEKIDSKTKSLTDEKPQAT